MGLLDSIKSEGAEVISHPVETQYALAYIRVSHQDSADRGTSLETQRRDIEFFASREGIHILESFEEPGRSAYKDAEKRVEFGRMIRHAKADPRVSLILVWKSDRFSRNRYEAAGIKGELAASGIRVLSAMEPYDSRTTSGIVMESVTDAMSQIRSIEIGQLTHKALLVNCEKRDLATGWAYKNGGMAQFGFVNHRIYTDTFRRYQRISHCVWLLDEEIVSGKPIHEWARIMLIEWRLKERAGPDVIAMRFTEAGIPTARGRKAWSDSTVNYLLMPDKLLQYAGYALWNRRDFRKGKRPKDHSEWKIIENAHQAIITPEEAEAIHAIRQGRTATPGKRGTLPSPYILTGGLLTCKVCGANFIGRRMCGVTYYCCGSHVYRHGADCDQAWYIRQEQADKAVFDVIQEYLVSNPKQLKATIRAYNGQVNAVRAMDKSAETDRQAKIEARTKEIEHLMDSLAEGINPEAVREAINERMAHRARLQAIAETELPTKITFKAVSACAANLRQIAESNETDRKRIAVRQYIAALEAEPEGRSIRVTLQPFDSMLSAFGGSP